MDIKTPGPGSWIIERGIFICSALVSAHGLKNEPVYLSVHLTVYRVANVKQKGRESVSWINKNNTFLRTVCRQRRIWMEWMDGGYISTVTPYYFQFFDALMISLSRK